jgi:malate:Na+ symporter
MSDTNIEPQKPFSSLYFPLVAMMIIGAAAMYLNVLPSGLIGMMCLMMPLALILERFGNWLPIWNVYMGGAPLILMFAGSCLVYFGVLPTKTVEIATGFMKSGSNFLDFYICGLIVGAILSIDSKMLIQAGVRYVVPMLCCIIAVAVMVTGAALAMGFPLNHGVGMIGIPILGGGIGAGVVPLSQVISQTISEDVAKKMVSAFVPAVILGNIFSIFFAGFLDWLGKKYPYLSGNGQLMRNTSLHSGQPPNRLTPHNIIIGICVSTGLYTAGIVSQKLLGMVNIDVHNFVLTLTIVFILKVTNCVPDSITEACFTWFKFITNVFTALILLGIGIVFTDMKEVIASISPTYVTLCFTAVLASVIGAGLGGMLVGFYFVESAITAGLCMANMGGTGDVATLSACKRMSLMPFARISTSIGGGVVIILAGTFVKYLYGNQ